MANLHNKLETGITLVEVIIATAIILTSVLSLLGVYNLYLKTALTNGELVQATYLLEEGVEAIRSLRDGSWTTNIDPLILGVGYGVVLNSGVWQASTTNTWVDDFQRVITLSAVNRDASGDIVSSGGTLDPDTLLITASASWPLSGATTTRSISTYITNLLEN